MRGPNGEYVTSSFSRFLQIIIYSKSDRTINKSNVNIRSRYDIVRLGLFLQ